VGIRLTPLAEDYQPTRKAPILKVLLGVSVLVLFGIIVGLLTDDWHNIVAGFIVGPIVGLVYWAIARKGPRRNM
jgi:hypothetical protein